MRLGTVPAMGAHTVTVGKVRRAVAPLLLGSLCAQVLLNGPPVLIPALATNEAEITRAGQFIAAFTLARVPLFLVVPLQTALLPMPHRAAALGRPRGAAPGHAAHRARDRSASASPRSCSGTSPARRSSA